MLLSLSVLLFTFPAFLSAPVRDRCTTGKNKLLLISFDGFRWDYDRDVDTPNLDKMAEEGVKAAYVTPPFLAITSPTHFTLLSDVTKSSLHNVFVGLAAVAGFLLLVFVVVTSYNIYKRWKAKMRAKVIDDEDQIKADSKQTSF